MQDAVLMGSGKARRYLDRIIDKLSEGQGPLGKQSPKGRALEQLVDDVNSFTVYADIVNPDDVRVTQLRGCPRFS